MGVEPRLDPDKRIDELRVEPAAFGQGLDGGPDLTARRQGPGELRWGVSGPRGATRKEERGAPRYRARKTMEAFWPPNPRLLLSTVLTFAARAAFGT